MKIDFSTWEWWHYLIAAVLWICFGIILDVVKLTISILGNQSGKATGKLYGISHAGRINIIPTVDTLKIEMRFVRSISEVFGNLRCSILGWSNNLFRQVVKNEDSDADSTVLSLAEPIPDASSKQNNDEGETYLVPCKNKAVSVFASQPDNKYAGQQVVGAFMGFLALLLFVYADASQGAQTFTLLFEGEIPQFLNSIIVPLMTASIGSALVLGALIGDLMGLTHLGLFEKNSPRVFLWITCINLCLSLLLSTIVALARMKLLGTDIPEIQFLVNVAQSVVILPMLVTTALLFKAWTGLFVALAILLSIFAVPVAIFEFIVRVSSDLLKFGVIGGKFIISRITWVVIGVLELVFYLLELAVKGSFAVLLYIVIGVFFIPNLIFTGILVLTNTRVAFREFLKELLRIDLNTIGSDEVHS